MSQNPPKRSEYADMTEDLLRQLGAESCILLVAGGDKGNGMSHAYDCSFDRRELPVLHAEQLDFIAAELRRRAGVVQTH